MAWNGIFCLEGEWEADMRRRVSVEPLLELLEGLKRVRYIHRDVATVEEFDYLVGQWQKRRYDDFRVLYLAMHGSAGSVRLGRDSLDLHSLGERLAGLCDQSVVYFGSCLTMDAEDADLRAFVKKTGARAAVGYSTEIDWVKSASFEVVLLDQLVTHIDAERRSDFIFRRIVAEHGDYASGLGLTIATPNRVYRA